MEPVNNITKPMQNKFISSNKLATLEELRYLLLKVLDRAEPMPWQALSTTCKEKTLNFAYAFENTITFLHLISVIKIHEDQSVSRVVEENFEALKSDDDLAVFITDKTLAYLDSDEATRLTFSSKTVTTDIASDTFVINTAEIPLSLVFIRVLLLNLKMAMPDKIDNTRLLVSKVYKDYFGRNFLNRVIEENKPLKKPTFFISYAHKDEKYKNELQNHFSGLVRKEIIEVWDGQAILPGEDWDEEIREKMENAEFILFLVSSDFMASEYIHNVEIKKAIERYNKGLIKIIPVIVRPCDYKNLPFGGYQAVPKDAKPISDWENQDAAYLDIVERIKKILPKTLKKPA